MNNSQRVLSLIGFTALLGIVRQSGSLSREEMESDLKRYFAIPDNKEIPKSYLKHELARLTVLPSKLRTEAQENAITMIQEYMS